MKSFYIHSPYHLAQIRSCSSAEVEKKIAPGRSWLGIACGLARGYAAIHGLYAHHARKTVQSFSVKTSDTDRKDMFA